jgi:ribonuclease D
MADNLPLYRGDLPADVAAAYADSRQIAIDTETTGLNFWRDRLCLVQMTDEHGHLAMVQILPGQRPERLLAILTDPDKLKILHFARFDVARLKASYDVTLAPIFCTKIASKMARTSTDRHGLKDLVQNLIGVSLDKEKQTSDWGADRLSPEQLQYAANDVLHLIEIKEILTGLLQREGRLEMAEACFAFLPTLANFDRLGWEGVFEH